MSQQQCLPLPPRRRKRELPSNDGTSCCNSNNEISGPVTIDDLSTMDAMEYLAAVNDEASALPDIFVFTTTTGKKVETNNKSSSNNNNSTRIKETKSKGRNEKGKQDYVPIDGSAASLMYLLSSRTDLIPPPTSLCLPHSTRAWVEGTISNFSTLRLYLEECRGNKGTTGKKTIMAPHVRMVVPKLEDRSGWHMFCLGYDEAMGNVGGYFDDDDDDDDDDDVEDDDDDDDDDDVEDDDDDDEDPDEEGGDDGNGQPSGLSFQQLPKKKKNDSDHTEEEGEEWKDNIPPTGHIPTTQLLLQMDQVMTRRVLAHHVYYIKQGWTLSKNCGAWIYALLARLERPLHRDENALLRELLRLCTKLRADVGLKQVKMKEEEEEEKVTNGIGHDVTGDVNGGNVSKSKYAESLATLNVLIAIIGIYFEQGGGYDKVMSVPGLL